MANLTSSLPAPRTLVRKIWDSHTILTADNGQSLLYVDRHLLHDGSSQSFEKLDAEGHGVRSSDRTIATADHYVQTRSNVAAVDSDAQRMILNLARNTRRFGITHYGAGHRRQGIAHVIGPELGITLPGAFMLCGDSHTSTHGAIGAFAFGIGASEVAHVLATQTLWQAPPKVMRIDVHDALPSGVASKDLILHIIGLIGTGGAAGHVLEFAGTAIAALSLEARLTVCNMSIEAGARAGIMAPDEVTFDYLAGCPFSPKGDLWNQAVAYWRTLRSDAGAPFDRELRVDASTVQPTVTWGTSSEDTVCVTGSVPNPNDDADPHRRARRIRALDYMGLKPGVLVSDIKVDRVFIGSCANSRIEDLRAASAVLNGRTVRVPTMVVPGSARVKARAEAEGLDRVFLDAGAEWREPGCSMCVAINGSDIVASGERCASTSNRNFAGRQGPGARTHLMSPATAAATAVTGRICDPRDFERSSR